MINAEIIRGESGNVIGFKVANHGESIVCAAVSMLVLNTVNSIEALTEDDFNCEYNDEGGYLEFTLNNPSFQTTGVKTLLDAMVLGLTSTLEQYPSEISLTDPIVRK